MTRQPHVNRHAAGSLEPQYLTLVGPRGRTARLYCPFIAVCICPVGTIPKMVPVTVMGIRTTVDGRLVYMIGGQGYYQSNFRVLIEL